MFQLISRVWNGGDETFAVLVIVAHFIIDFKTLGIALSTPLPTIAFGLIFLECCSGIGVVHVKIRFWNIQFNAAPEQSELADKCRSVIYGSWLCSCTSAWCESWAGECGIFNGDFFLFTEQANSLHLCLEPWQINSEDRDHGGLLADTYLHLIDKNER